jgi:hypothetical protein
MINKMEMVCGSCLHVLPHHYTKRRNLVCSRCGHVKKVNE